MARARLHPAPPARRGLAGGVAGAYLELRPGERAASRSGRCSTTSRCSSSRRTNGRAGRRERAPRSSTSSTRRTPTRYSSDGPERVKLEYVEHKPSFSLVSAMVGRRRRGNGWSRRGRATAPARASTQVLEKGDRPGGSMLLSSGVVWRHRSLEDFRRGVSGRRPGAPAADRRAARRGSRLARVAWRVPAVEHETRNPRTIGRRFEPRPLTQALVRAAGGVSLSEPLGGDARRSGRARHRRVRG